MSQASTALKSARTYLNDIHGHTWTDPILMGFLQEAHGELVQELDLNQVGVLKQVSPVITVPTNTLSLPNQPTNILDPVSMVERTPGDDADFFQPMIRVNFLPDEDQDQVLVFWAWNQEIIKFVGATENREVILRYYGSIATPQFLTDPLGFIYGERYLGPRVAELALASVGKPTKHLAAIAEQAKFKLIQRAVLNDQTPVRRKAYRSSKLGSGRGPSGTFGSF